jgi:hypothetical protein
MISNRHAILQDSCAEVLVVFPFSIECFPIIISFVFNFSLSEDSNRAEFIVKYSTSDLVVIFLFLL